MDRSPMLDGPRLAPAAGGAPRQLVIFLHGYGADGNDLIGIGREWARALPHAAFVSPHAPQACEMVPVGRQWFALTFRQAGEIERGVAQAAPELSAFIDAELERHGLGAEALALVGFSQGAMMALHVGLSRQPPPAVIVSYSGALGNVAVLEGASQRRRPAILLVHGDMDPVIPVEALFHARAQLAAAGVPLEWHIAQGMGHGIDGESLRLGGAFLKQAFDAAASKQAQIG